MISFPTVSALCISVPESHPTGARTLRQGWVARPLVAALGTTHALPSALLFAAGAAGGSGGLGRAGASSRQEQGRAQTRHLGAWGAVREQSPGGKGLNPRRRAGGDGGSSGFKRAGMTLCIPYLILCERKLPPLPLPHLPPPPPLAPRSLQDPGLWAAGERSLGCSLGGSGSPSCVLPAPEP